MQSKKFSLVFTLLLSLVATVGYVNARPPSVSVQNDAVSLLALAAGASRQPEGQGQPTTNQPKTKHTETKQIEASGDAASSWRTVARVIDGDTVALGAEDGGVETVRLIGLDTPEVVDSKKPVQCFGPEASGEAVGLLLGQRVRLESDSSQGTQDVYGRTLGYLFLQDGTNVAEHMIAEGFGREYTFKKAYRYQAAFRAAQAQAKGSGRGLWGACGVQ